MTGIVAVFSLFITRRLMARLGARTTLIAGLTLNATGNLLFAHAAVGSSYLTAVLPVMVLGGVGAGLSFMPSVSLAMAEAGPGDSGLVSGLANVSTQIGAALGVAILASLSTVRTNGLLSRGHALRDALTSGYDQGFLIAGGCGAGAVFVAALILRPSPQ
jgi:MFS family permease